MDNSGSGLGVPSPTGPGKKSDTRRFLRCTRSRGRSRFPGFPTVRTPTTPPLRLALPIGPRRRMILTRPFRHRYYDPLRLPNVRREILRYPARHSLPVASAFCCTRGIDPAEPRAFPAGSFGIAVDSHGCHPALVRAFKDRKTMRLSQVPVQSVSAWPGLRPRWSLPRLATDAMTGAAFRHVETVRVRKRRTGSPPLLLPYGTTSFKQLSGLNTHPTDLLGPAHDLCFLRPSGFATGLVASRYPERTSTS
jgi:hypothetical protein